MFKIEKYLQARGYWAEASAEGSPSGSNEINSMTSSGNAVDQIAALLSGEPAEKVAPLKVKKPIEESEEADTQPDDSNQEAEELEEVLKKL